MWDAFGKCANDTQNFNVNIHMPKQWRQEKNGLKICYTIEHKLWHWKLFVYDDNVSQLLNFLCTIFSFSSSSFLSMLCISTSCTVHKLLHFYDEKIKWYAWQIKYTLPYHQRHSANQYYSFNNICTKELNWIELKEKENEEKCKKSIKKFMW